MSNESKIPFEILTDPNMKIVYHESPNDTDELEAVDSPELWNGDKNKVLPLSILSTLIAEELFGDQMDNKDDMMFLSGVLDETQPLQSELISKLVTMFESNGINPPDRISLQVFRRKAGFAPNRKDTDMGCFAMAICLKDFQLVVFDRKEEIILNGNFSSLYEFKPHPEKIKEVSARPSVPRNRTLIKLPNGKILVKSKVYLSIVGWAFWVDDPIKRHEPKNKFGTEQLQNIFNEMKEDHTVIPDQG